MIDALIRTFLRAPILAIVLCGVLLIWGWFSFQDNPKDAIPDIAENQAIVFSEWAGRSPKDVDEQVTYPLMVALQGVPGVKEVRATSGFGWSLVYAVFHDGIDFYWARSRVLERLSATRATLPDGVVPKLGPEATPLGQVFWYTLENGWFSPQRPGLRFDENGRLTSASREALLKNNPHLQKHLDESEPYQCPLTGNDLVFSQLPLDRLRSLQDYDVKLALESVEGVSEIASIGGYVRQYQIDIDPDAMRAFGVPLETVVSAVKASNLDVGAKIIEQNGMEILIRGVGFLGGGERRGVNRSEREQAAIADIENIVVKSIDGTPVYVRQLGTICVGPDFRRGALDKEGAEAVGGSVVMRFGENPLAVIDRLKQRIAAIEAGLPSGVRINAFYDRTQLIHETMATLQSALSQELVITVVIVLLFLLHLRSGLVVALTLPLAVLFAFICMQGLKLLSNIMSLAGIAIAIGTMVDMAIVMTENIYQHLSERSAEYTRIETGENGTNRRTVDHQRRHEIVFESASEVSGAILTAISTTVISFVPVFFLGDQSGKLFTPLAWTKTFCLVGSILLALTVVPPLASLMLRTRRPSRKTAVGIAAAVAIVLGLCWSLLTEPGSMFTRLAEALRALLRVPQPWDMIAGSAFAGLFTYAILRERIRPIQDNPVGQMIRAIYEPILRLLLRHKLLFLTVPVVLVLWGLSIWLGPGPIIRALVTPLLMAGLHPMDWSMSWWVHLAAGLVVGLVVLPLVVDTVQVVSGRSRASQAGKWPIRMGYLAIGLVAAFAFERAGAVNLFEGISAVFAALGVTDPKTGEPISPDEYKPLTEWAGRPGIGKEFMPPLDEGDFLYMPSVLPSGSLNTVLDIMQKQDVQFARIPEVETVVGKLGRIDSALDPAPVGMLETIIKLKPRQEWPLIRDPDGEGRRRRTRKEIWAAIQAAGRFPGVLPSVQLQPIRTRIEMLSTGLSARIGLKIYGDDAETCESLAVEIETLLRDRLAHAEAINASRVSDKPYLEFHIDREAIARYGIHIADVQRVIETAMGGMNLTTTYEGLDRYPVRVRYLRELRDEPDDLGRVLVATHGGAQIPIRQLADLRLTVGPMSVRREGAKYVSYVTMNNVGIDETRLVRDAQAILAQAMIEGTLTLPEGYHFKWSGSYQRQLRDSRRLTTLIPLVLLINFILIHLQFKRVSLTFIVFLAIPVSFAGGFILLNGWPSIQNALNRAGIMDRGFEHDAIYLTTAVWIGFIALFGIAVDDGIVMGTYLNQAFRRHDIKRQEDIVECVVQAGLRRIRPCLMTSLTTLAALVPVVLSTGRGSDVMVPIALPVLGGMFVVLISLFVVPTCYCGLKQLKWRLGLSDPDFIPAATSE